MSKMGSRTGRVVARTHRCIPAGAGQPLKSRLDAGNNPSCCLTSRIAARPRFYVRGKNDRRCSMCLCRSAFDRLFLGLPAGLPDLPLMNRVALPASCSFSYRPAAAFDSAGEVRLLGESVMGTPIVVEGDPRHINATVIAKSSKFARIIMSEAEARAIEHGLTTHARMTCAGQLSN